MEYLLGQSNRGDLLTTLQQSEIGVTLPEMQDEVQEDECDVTITNATDIIFHTSQTTLSNPDVPLSQVI